MPHGRGEWMIAMERELEQIADTEARNRFAYGCFKAALFEYAKSRKGLSWLARTGGAALIFAGSCAIIHWTTQAGAERETLAFANLITGLCLIYMCGAALLMTTLRGLKIYAGLGFAAAAISWIYFRFMGAGYKDLPPEFLTALSVEVAGFMGILLAASVYLNWLYRPEIHEA